MKINKKITVIVTMLIMFVCCGIGFCEAKTKIALFTTRNQGDMFWQPVADFMKAACDNLGMDLNVYYAGGDHLKMVKQIEEVANEPAKPAFIVFPNFKKQGIYAAKACEKAQVKFFIFNSGLFPEDNAGIPREKFKYWIGEMLPDDAGAGYNLAKLLVKNAPAAKDGKIHMLALEGIPSDTASIERVKGLKKFLAENKNVVLEQIVAANWDPKEAKEKFIKLKARYPEITVCWTASDGMALGVSDAAKELNLIIDKNLYVGGVDWSKEGIEGVRDGKVSATVGGHFMEGGWVAVLLYDYIHGKDFASETLQIRSNMTFIDKSNVAAYLSKLSNENWGKINFKKFSKTENASQTKYNFGLEALFVLLK